MGSLGKEGDVAEMRRNVLRLYKEQA